MKARIFSKVYDDFPEEKTFVIIEQDLDGEGYEFYSSIPLIEMDNKVKAKEFLKSVKNNEFITRKQYSEIRKHFKQVAQKVEIDYRK